MNSSLKTTAAVHPLILNCGAGFWTTPLDGILTGRGIVNYPRSTRHTQRRRRLALWCLEIAAGICLATEGWAQRPQDNWYLEHVWTKDMAVTNGGLLEPYGVAIGPDGRIYVGDEGAGQVCVYTPDGDFNFMITNGFGGGQSFANPRGMTTDGSGNLYVADKGQHFVFVFNPGGDFVRAIGAGSGSGDGQLLGPTDVAIGPNEEVFVLENGNSRVSVFGTDGVFKRKWGSPGLLTGELLNPLSIAVSKDGRVYVCQDEYDSATRLQVSMKEFDRSGLWVRTLSTFEKRGGYGDEFAMGGASVRLDPGDFPHVVISQFTQDSYELNLGVDHRPYCRVWQRDGSLYQDYIIDGTDVGQWVLDDFRTPCHAIGRDGTVVFCSSRTKRLVIYRLAYRDQTAVPRNAIPIPSVVQTRQRASSPLVDIDYRVADADDTNVSIAMLVFTNASSSPCLSNCLNRLTLVEGTSTNLGVGIAANQTHRVTWNAGADWSVNLGDYRVAVLARDNRPGLLDIHYVSLPADRGMPALKISRSPLTGDDFMQVWWWLLATQDPGLSLSSNRVYGVNGVYAAKVLCEDNATTEDGREFVFEKMQVREATPQEVDWSRHGSTSTTVNQWPPGRSVGGRPLAVNEYGFDTGDWDTNTCRWVVPLH